MQVKKFEAPTLQEALDTVKRELGPEAIILQTKKYKRGFGLMSKPSVEVTAAVSDRSINKKQYAETRLPQQNRDMLGKLSADRQAEFYDKYNESRVRKPAASAIASTAGTALATMTAGPSNGTGARRLTATRYIDIDEDQIPAPTARAQAPRAGVPTTTPSGVTAANATPGVSAKSAVSAKTGMTVEEELRHLKRMIDEMKAVQEDSSFGSGAQALAAQSRLSNPVLQSAFEQLIINGIDKRYAFELVKRVSFELGELNGGTPKPGQSEAILDFLAAEIMRNTEVSSPLSGIVAKNADNSNERGPAVLALVGPTGVGKTTTVAKIASEAILKRNLKVGLINLDGYKVAAFDQLGTYARILNVPFRSAGSVEDLNAAMQDFKSLDLVLIDTTGRSQKDPASLAEMQKLLEAIPGIRSQLVLSVTTRDTELYDMANRFSIFHPEGIIVSKLDEGTIYGAVFNICQKAKLPLAYFTTGQRVPEDIEDATQERVAALVLDL